MDKDETVRLRPLERGDVTVAVTMTCQCCGGWSTKIECKHEDVDDRIGLLNRENWGVRVLTITQGEHVHTDHNVCCPICYGKIREHLNEPLGNMFDIDSEPTTKPADKTNEVE